MTPVDIETAARDQYNATGDTFFSQTAIMTLIYKAQCQLVAKAPVIERTFTTPSVASQREYDYPTEAFSIWRAEYNGMPMSKVTFREDDSVNNLTSAVTTTGTPRYYSIWNNTLFLRPSPAVDADTIKLYTYNIPQTVTSTSVLEVPVVFHAGIIDFVLSEMFAKDTNVTGAMYYRKLWSETLIDAIKYTAKRKRGGGPAHVQTEETLITNILGTI